MDIVLYSFSKNNNSTKMPISDGTRITGCNIKEPCSVITPTIILSATNNPYRFNYCYIPKFERYYYINNYVYNAGRWAIECKVDTLATYRTYIGNSSQYILRSAYTYDGEIQDTRYPIKAKVTINSSGYNPVDPDDPGLSFDPPPSGVYVVGIISPEASAVGPVAYYQMTNAQFRSFCNAMLSTTDWVMNGLEEISAELTKVLLNPFQYVASCMWFPKAFATGGSARITFGWWTLPVSAQLLTQTQVLYSTVFNIPKHPLAETRGKYLNFSPFTRYTLDWPVFGRFPIDPYLLSDADRLIIQCYADAISGGGVLRLFAYVNGAFVTLATSNVSVGVNIQLAQVATDYIGSVSSIIGTVSQAFSGNILGALSNIGNVANSMMPQIKTTNKNGMTSAWKFPPVLESEFFDVVDEDNEHLGRPLCQKRTISELPGYMEVESPELEISGTEVELQEIKNYMAGGFYYE